MPLDDDDVQTISDLIDQRVKAGQRPAGRRQPAGPGTGEERSSADRDWDEMNPLQKQRWIREVVESELAALDGEAEKEEMRRELEELRAAKKEWEKGGRQGRKPTLASVKAGDKPVEEAPTIVNRFYKFMFGEAK